MSHLDAGAAMMAQDQGIKMSHILQDAEQPEGLAAGSLALVTLAGNEYRMPANLGYYECLEQLEDDVVNFLPSVADII